MRPIQMVDTQTQYQKIKSEVDEAIMDVLASSAYINGKPVSAFASELADYVGVKHCIPCANGTDALQIAMMALNLQPGDEVITPSFTYIATTEVIALLRLTPVFVDVDPDTFCMDPESLERAITPRTKAIVPVHLYGQAAHMEPIMAIAEKHGLFVIEDNAQAIGCVYTWQDGRKQKTGSIGHIGATSFYPSKNLGAFGDGGALFTNDDELAAKMRMIANHGQSRRYYHDVVGCNSRLDTIQAAVLRVKLKYLDDYNRARQAVAAHYDQCFAALPHFNVPTKTNYSTHVYHQYTLTLMAEKSADRKRQELIDWLTECEVPSMIYYPVPGHRQKMFEEFGTAQTKLPNTDWLTSRVLSLPIHTELDMEQADHIADRIIEFFAIV
ncbi:MAG: DegT/DnrJ/EryC1/StrS family aminotransferase [Chitinophagaceae bacterium]